MNYTKEDLKDLVKNKLDEVDEKRLDEIFGFKDAKTMSRKISGKLPLTIQDQFHIDYLMDVTNAGVRRMWRREALEVADKRRYSFEDELTEVSATGFYE